MCNTSFLYANKFYEYCPRNYMNTRNYTTAKYNTSMSKYSRISLYFRKYLVGYNLAADPPSKLPGIF